MTLSRPARKITIVGGGIIGYLEAVLEYLKFKQTGEPVKVSMYEMDPAISYTTGYNNRPSITVNEPASVVPRAEALLKAIQTVCTERGGIKMPDVPGILDSESVKVFLAEVEAFSKDANQVDAKNTQLLEYGKFAVSLWQFLYENMGDEFKKIMDESNYKPCSRPGEWDDPSTGYRCDPIFNHHTITAESRAEAIIKEHVDLGYQHCKILSPAEAEQRDPSLKHFCDSQSVIDETTGQRRWKSEACVVLRPGGRINGSIFLLKVREFLEKNLGTYLDENNQVKNCFHASYNKEVVGMVAKDNTAGTAKILESLLLNTTKNNGVKDNRARYGNHHEVILCPGKKVNTIPNLGIDFPAFTGFAGPSVLFDLTVPVSELADHPEYLNLDNCMEALEEDIVLAWQSKTVKVDDHHVKISIGVAGSKALSGEETPNNDQVFAQTKQTKLLNMINTIYPKAISMALGKDTTGMVLTFDHLQKLAQEGIVKLWVGNRAVAVDSMFSVGQGKIDGKPIEGVSMNTHGGSGGFAHGVGMVYLRRHALYGEGVPHPKAPQPPQGINAMVEACSPQRHYAKK